MVVTLANITFTARGTHEPPFLETDGAVVVGVDLLEELVQLRVGHHEPGPRKGGAHLGLVEPAVAIAVDAVEQDPELALGLLDKVSKLYGHGRLLRGARSQDRRLEPPLSGTGGSVVRITSRSGRTLILDDAVAVAVYGLHDMVQELVGVLERYITDEVHQHRH